MNTNIQSQFDLACQYFEVVQKLDQVGSATNVAQIEELIQSAEIITSGQNYQFKSLLSSAIGAEIGKEVQNQINTLLSDYQVTTTDANGANVQVQNATDHYDWVSKDGVDVLVHTVTYNGPVTLANFDPNARIGYAVDHSEWERYVDSIKDIPSIAACLGDNNTVNVTVNASDFEQFMKITPNANAAGDLVKFENLFG